MKINQGITFAILIWNLLVFMIMVLTNPKQEKVLGASRKNIYYHLHSFLVDLVLGWQVLPFITRLENGILKRFGS